MIGDVFCFVMSCFFLKFILDGIIVGVIIDVEISLFVDVEEIRVGFKVSEWSFYKKVM